MPSERPSIIGCCVSHPRLKRPAFVPTTYIALEPLYSNLAITSIIADTPTCALNTASLIKNRVDTQRTTNPVPTRGLLTPTLRVCCVCVLRVCAACVLRVCAACVLRVCAACVLRVLQCVCCVCCVCSLQ